MEVFGGITLYKLILGTENLKPYIHSLRGIISLYVTYDQVLGIKLGGVSHELKKQSKKTQTLNWGRLLMFLDFYLGWKSSHNIWEGTSFPYWTNEILIYSWACLQMLWITKTMKPNMNKWTHIPPIQIKSIKTRFVRGLS